jgi:exopolysaccharide production protein ExoY
MFRANEDFPSGVGASIRRPGHAPAVELSGIGALCKRTMDIIAAMCFFVVFLPLYGLIALGVRLTSPGPVFYSQERIGHHGRTFRFYKFRSMVENSDEVFNSFLDSDEEARSQWQTFQKLDRDPRITSFGKFIRRTSLDELPQFWNVLRGDMSLIGPRPCMPSQKTLYGQHWSSYCAVRPGLTGLWQVSGRNRLTYEDRVRLDARYVQNWTLWLDIRILLKTVKVVLTGDGSR